MSFSTRLASWLMRLPSAETHDIVVTRDLQIPMSDGVVLLADHYTPRQGPKRPTILVRSPYGRRGFFALVCAAPYVARGYQVVMQSCRGTAGSGGQFVYARREREDGLATIEWLKQQEWFSGELAMLGSSYLGFVQWAIAAEAGPELKALVPQITTSNFNAFRFQGGSFTLETSLNWSVGMTTGSLIDVKLRNILRMGRRKRDLARAYLHLPLKEADQVAIGLPSESFQINILHEPDDVYWEPVNLSAGVPSVQVPINLMGGWYDIFLDGQLKDYQALRGAGRQPYLLIGPWVHGQMASVPITARESLAWLNAQVKCDQSGLRKEPVRLFVMGTDEWRDFADWPLPTQPERWYLHPHGAFDSAPAPTSEPDHYRYDPADPTPAVGGNSLGAQEHMGPKDNRKLEARADVLVYTSAPLTQELEIIGPITAELYVHSSLEYTDFFARLCVVETSGKSINLCDGILRLTPANVTSQADGSWHIQIDLWPTAYHFRKGQRLRVQVSSGAHPRFIRNLGTGEPLATGNTLKIADQTVYHDPEHPSALLLPVCR
jgi:uncharacterized protein